MAVISVAELEHACEYVMTVRKDFSCDVDGVTEATRGREAAALHLWPN